jgi:hypothetical protein
LFDWKVGRLFAFKDSAYVDPRSTGYLAKAGAIADQPSSIWIFAPVANYRQRMPRGQRRDLTCLIAEKAARADPSLGTDPMLHAAPRQSQLLTDAPMQQRGLSSRRWHRLRRPRRRTFACNWRSPRRTMVAISPPFLEGPVSQICPIQDRRFAEVGLRD